MSQEPGAGAADEFRELPESPSIRHLKLQAKRRLAAGEFDALHDAQLAVAREHGMRSWAVLKRHVDAAAAVHCHALDQVRRIFRRYGDSDVPDWAAPTHAELSEHFTERFLSLVPPETLAKSLAGVAAQLRQEPIPVEADEFRLRASVTGLRVEAATEHTPPYRLAGLRIYPDGGPVNDARLARPPMTDFGPVPERVPVRIEESYVELGLVGLIAAGDWGHVPEGPAVWVHARGWADLERDVPLRPEHRFPARAITKLVTATAVLSLVARGVVGLDDPVGGHLLSLRLEDDAVTIRELLSHTGGVDSPPTVWGVSVLDPASVLGPVVGCSGPRGRFDYSNGGYALLGELIADVTGATVAQAITRLVLEPLGMVDSSFPTRHPGSTSEVPCGYHAAQDGALVPDTLPMFTLQAAGGLWSTARDLVRFGAGWRTLLPEELGEEALRPHASRGEAGAEIGLGWLLQHPKDVVGHAGSGPGFSASLILSPSSGRTSVVLTNRLTAVEAVNVRLIRPLGVSEE